MFTDKPEGKQVYPKLLGSGMWVVHVDSEQYRAWKWWLRKALNKKFFPEPTMQVWWEFPPTTPEGAEQVAKTISDIRDGENPYAPKRKDGSRSIIGGKAVPRRPAPWNGYVPPVPIDESRYPRDLKPWREILRQNGLSIPEMSPWARALDAIQAQPPEK